MIICGAPAALYWSRAGSGHNIRASDGRCESSFVRTRVNDRNGIHPGDIAIEISTMKCATFANKTTINVQ